MCLRFTVRHACARVPRYLQRMSARSAEQGAFSSRLHDRVCVVTGGGSGIGAAVVQRFRAEGAVVVSFDVEPVAPTESAPHETVLCDVTEESQVAAAFDRVIAVHGRLDVAVANAGIGEETRLTELTLASWNRMIGVNLTGPFLTAKHAVLRMTQGGVLVFHASMSGLVATADEPAYCASKAGVIGLARAIAVDYAKQGIRANAVCPGVVDTPMTAKQFAPSPEFRVAVERQHPIGRFANPAEIAAATAFLASDDSSFMTGAVLTVDGGYTAR